MHDVAKVCLGAVLASVARDPEDMLSAIVSDPVEFPGDQSGDLEHPLEITAQNADQAARQGLAFKVDESIASGLLAVLVPNQQMGLQVGKLSVTKYAVPLHALAPEC